MARAFALLPDDRQDLEGIVAQLSRFPGHLSCCLSHRSVRPGAGALRNGAPFKDWVLPASIDKIRRKLAGLEDGDRQMVSILSAVLQDGLPAVEAACTQALQEGVCSADVILNIMARQMEPTAPVTIMTTPQALRLRTEPMADCARYDSLSRAI